MINLKVGEQQCQIPQSWDEISVKDYTKIYSLIVENEFIEPPIEARALMNKQEIKSLEAERALHNVRINRNVFAAFTGIDQQTINQVDGKEMSDTLLLMTNFLNSESERKSQQTNQRYSFKFKNKKYMFPTHNMKDSTFGDFIEAAQLNVLAEKNKAGKFAVIAEQMAILCREKDEVYNEKLVAKKSNLFGDLKMDIVWDFLFFLTKQINTYNPSIPTFLKAEAETTTDMQPKILKS